MDMLIKHENLHEVMKQIADLTEVVKTKYVDPKSVIYTSDQLVEILDVSKSTLQKLRVEGYLSYSQIKGKFFYRQSDLDEMLANNLVKNYRYENKK
jgi:uncharacterized membrane protein